MAHFAKLNEHNVVLRISVVDNVHLLNENGDEVEQLGIDYLEKVHGKSDIERWVQCSFSASFRSRFPVIGGIYSPDLDKFLPPKPRVDWTLGSEEIDDGIFVDIWEPPIPKPENPPEDTPDEPECYTYIWNENEYLEDTSDPKTKGWDYIQVLPLSTDGPVDEVIE